MVGVLELLLLATGAAALRAPPPSDSGDDDTSRPSFDPSARSALRADYDSPRPALRTQYDDPLLDSPGARPAASAPRVDYDSPRPALRAKYDDSPRPFRATPGGYQFSSFRGPVSGNIEEIEVPFVLPQGAVTAYGDARNLPTKSVDYKAKPDYSFTYGMHDPESGVAQAQAEAREGDTVKGEYSVMEPDGTLRTVTYVADPVHGFQASVKYGPSGLPPPPPPTPTPTSGYTGPAARPQAREAPKPLPHRFKVPRPAPAAPAPRPVYRSYGEYDEDD